MNPYAIIAALVVAIGLWFGGDHVGHTRGINEQKVADQGKFDKVNADLTENKAEAAGILKTKNAEILALMIERETLKTTLEKDREKNRVATNALRDKYASIGLRIELGKDSGRWPGGGSASSTVVNSTGVDAAAILQLPDTVTGNLRQLVFDADNLADEYRKCYGYAQQVK